MKVFLTTAYTEDAPSISAAYEIAKLDRYQIHQVVDNPDAADLILFVEHDYRRDYFFKRLRNHPLVKKYPTKTLIHNRQAKPFYVIPGLYVSPDKQYADRERQIPTIYVEEVNEYIDIETIGKIEPDILYSFIGATSALIRRKLFTIDHPHGLIRDTTGLSVFRPHLSTSEEIKKHKQDYAEILGRTKFVLCPRGIATSSFRLYETMKIGRVPVILSDNWMPPAGPKWEDFAIFIPEKDVCRLEEILKENEPTWRERGELARQAWEEFFAPDVRFHYFIEQCREILENANGNPSFFKQRITRHEIYMRIRRSTLIDILMIKIIKPIIIKIYEMQ